MKTTSYFSEGNKKLIHCGNTYRIRVASFDLLSGVTCPAASLCHSEIEIVDGKRKVVDYGQFRCYATSTEALYPAVYEMRKNNGLLAKSDNFINTIHSEIKRLGLTSVRIHSSGDMFSPEYMKKWIQIARMSPDVEFWGYTKMATYVKFLNAEPNMFFVYSVGGIFDNYATKYNLPSCYVITSYNQAVELGVDVACEAEYKSNDYEYILRGESFSLMIHGTQKAGSKKNLPVTF